jgi:hypothetical protein
MQAYDALPQPLRQWLAGAVLPWSAKSCKRIWTKALRDGQDIDQIISTLTRVEQKALNQDKQNISNRS